MSVDVDQRSQSLDVRAPWEPSRHWPWVAIGWPTIVLLFALQWYAYDSARGEGNPIGWYLAWSSYVWALAPLVFLFAHRFPLELGTWRFRLPLHIAASLLVAGVQIGAETYIGWLRHAHGLSVNEAIRHYFSQHTQPSLLVYWMLVAAASGYRLQERSRMRELQTARLESRLAQTRLQMLRMQLQPHFLFNTLQAATTLVQDDPPAAEDVLQRLGELLRFWLDEPNLNEFSLAREIELLECYTGIQERRFGSRVKFDIQVSAEVRVCLVPAFVLQPLVENAVQHGIGAHRGNDMIKIACYREQTRLYLEVHNRIGSLEDVPERLLHRGTGLSNVKARIEQLYGTEQSLELCNLHPEGVCTRVSLPFRRLPSAAAPLAMEAGQ
jgi:two-component system, LytTR family, sensor kinase